jgi:hypothetical protein
MTKPFILVEFDQNGCLWMSDGWGNDSKLMAKAREAIRRGETREEVIELLSKTFEVEVVK